MARGILARFGPLLDHPKMSLWPALMLFAAKPTSSSQRGGAVKTQVALIKG